MSAVFTKDQKRALREACSERAGLREEAAVDPQKCKFCDRPAARSLIWAGGKGYTPVCPAHDQEARNVIAMAKSSVVDVKEVDQRPVFYREHTLSSHARLQAALSDAPSPGGPEESGTYFGRQGANGRAESALSEAPVDPPPRVSIGRRDSPRGVVTKTRTGGDIIGVTGTPIKRTTGKGLGNGTGGPDRVYQLPDKERQEIPDSLLQMLGSDWTTMRVHRDHDNRMTATVDGVRYTIYTRRG